MKSEDSSSFLVSLFIFRLLFFSLNKLFIYLFLVKM